MFWYLVRLSQGHWAEVFTPVLLRWLFSLQWPVLRRKMIVCWCRGSWWSASWFGLYPPILQCKMAFFLLWIRVLTSGGRIIVVSVVVVVQGPVSWRPTTVKWRQFSQSNRHSTIGTWQTEYHEALPSSANDEVWGVTARSPTMVTLFDTLSSAVGGMTVGLWKLSSLDGRRPPWYRPQMLLLLLFFFTLFFCSFNDRVNGPVVKVSARVRETALQITVEFVTGDIKIRILPHW